VKRLWLLLVPAFGMPDMLFSEQTAVGILKSTDWIILPYLLLLMLAGAGRIGKDETRPLTSLLWFFCGWALLSTLTVPLRYAPVDFQVVQMGIVKVGKFALYAAAGIGTIRAVLADPQVLPRFQWAILLSLLLSGVSTYVTTTTLLDLPNSPAEAGFQFEAMNAVSVQISIVMAFVLGEWVANRGTAAWRSIGIGLLPIPVFGFLVTGGRGGWVGLVVALAYVLLKVGMRPSFVVAGLVVVMVGTFAYSENDSFRLHVDITVKPELLAQETEFAQTTGFDDGNRFTIFVHESQQLLRSPVLGAGMFHRGGRSGLDSRGSHNFFLQMLLETGLVGGIAIIMLFRRMWLVAGQGPTPGTVALGVRAALVAAIVGGSTGEYFYGGPVLFMLLAVMVPAFLNEQQGSEPVTKPVTDVLPTSVVTS
jgi:O-antigen ligase